MVRECCTLHDYLDSLWNACTARKQSRGAIESQNKAAIVQQVEIPSTPLSKETPGRLMNNAIYIFQRSRLMRTEYFQLPSTSTQVLQPPISFDHDVIDVEGS